MKLLVGEQERGQHLDVRRDAVTSTTRDRHSLRGLCHLPLNWVGWDAFYKRKSNISCQVKQVDHSHKNDNFLVGRK